MEFFGRESELNVLLSLWDKCGGSFVTCRGRRQMLVLVVIKIAGREDIGQ